MGVAASSGSSKTLEGDIENAEVSVSSGQEPYGTSLRGREAMPRWSYKINLGIKGVLRKFLGRYSEAQGP